MRYWNRTQTELTSQGKQVFASMPNAGFVSETIDPRSYGQRCRNMILGGFLPPGFRYRLASLGLLGKMSGQDLAQK